MMVQNGYSLIKNGQSRTLGTTIEYFYEKYPFCASNKQLQNQIYFDLKGVYDE